MGKRGPRSIEPTWAHQPPRSVIIAHSTAGLRRIFPIDRTIGARQQEHTADRALQARSGTFNSLGCASIRRDIGAVRPSVRCVASSGTAAPRRTALVGTALVSVACPCISWFRPPSCAQWAHSTKPVALSYTVHVERGYRSFVYRIVITTPPCSDV